MLCKKLHFKPIGHPLRTWNPLHYYTEKNLYKGIALYREMSDPHDMTSPSEYGLPEFEDLQTSTRTFMVYSNIEFDLKTIFECASTTPIEVPLTKRKKNIDRRKLKAPSGSIISLQKEHFIRGIDTRRVKKHWCTSCRLTTEKGGKEVDVNTVVEELKPLDDKDLFQINYFCTNCERYYTSQELGKIPHFLNQVTVVISVGDTLLNVMIFRGNFKIAGCKQDDDAYRVTRILWERFIQPEPKAWSIKEGKNVRFIFRKVMRNVGFNLGFSIDLNRLNTLMNDDKYRDYVDVAQRETTGHPNVNISMYSKRPEDFTYDTLVYKHPNLKNRPIQEQIVENPYEKKEKKTHTTFIVFSSSQIILSGRYPGEMKRLYNLFITEVMKHRDELQERLRKPDSDLLAFIGGMEGSSRSARGKK